VNVGSHILKLSPRPMATGLSKEGGIAPMTSYISALIASFRSDDEGQGLAEYALILALIAIVAIIALIFLGGQVSKILSSVGNSV
jgi:pilus assembly protein Flp/PilA